ncbi:hypothetical protein [Variovorax sp.]|uniref:hypothetical protein n=1 Tax=Variovorax sp. TaxID=1871043 RepID=UPI0037DA5DD7
MTHGTQQSVKIETLTEAGKTVEGAKCTLTNDRNGIVMRSGESVSVRRSGALLNIECTQPGLAPATGQAISRVNTGMVGNILIGGVLGAAIDSGTGAGFNYPSWMQLVFGEVRSFDRSGQTGDQALAGVRIGETRLAAPSVVPPPPTAIAVTPPPVAEEKPATPPVVAAVPPPVAIAPPPVAPAAPVVPPPAPRAVGARVSMEDLGALLPAKP